MVSLMPLFLLSLVSLASAQYWRYPTYSEGPQYPNLYSCSSIPPYQIPVEAEPQPATSDAPPPQAPPQSYFTRLGNPDPNGLRTPLEDSNIPENATRLDDVDLLQRFIDVELENTSILRPDIVSGIFC
eukprot:scpid103016/ scgid4410/ 